MITALLKFEEVTKKSIAIYFVSFLFVTVNVLFRDRVDTSESL